MLQRIDPATGSFDFRRQQLRGFFAFRQPQQIRQQLCQRINRLIQI